MKKNYLNPKTLIIEVNTQSLMSISGDNVSVSENNYDSNKGSILSRRGGDSSWEDEE